MWFISHREFNITIFDIFGGQPLAPGFTRVWSWLMGWLRDCASFARRSRGLMRG